MTLDGLLTRAIVWIRNRQYKAWSRTREQRAEKWKNAAYLAELDRIETEINRADRIKLNRSVGARKGWETRRANAAKRNAEQNADVDALALQRISAGWVYGQYDEDDCN